MDLDRHHEPAGLTEDARIEDLLREIEGRGGGLDAVSYTKGAAEQLRDLGHGAVRVLGRAGGHGGEEPPGRAGEAAGQGDGRRRGAREAQAPGEGGGGVRGGARPGAQNEVDGGVAPARDQVPADFEKIQPPDQPVVARPHGREVGAAEDDLVGQRLLVRLGAVLQVVEEPFRPSPFRRRAGAGGDLDGTHAGHLIPQPGGQEPAFSGAPEGGLQGGHRERRAGRGHAPEPLDLGRLGQGFLQAAQAARRLFERRPLGQPEPQVEVPRVGLQAPRLGHEGAAEEGEHGVEERGGEEEGGAGVAEGGFEDVEAPCPSDLTPGPSPKGEGRKTSPRKAPLL